MRVDANSGREFIFSAPRRLQNCLSQVAAAAQRGQTGTNNMPNGLWSQKLRLSFLLTYLLAAGCGSGGSNETVSAGGGTHPADHDAAQANAERRPAQRKSLDDFGPFPDIPSQWLASRKDRARSALSDHQYDVLVVPFQVKQTS